MDKIEYIPGDLVMTNGVPLCTAKNVVYRVTSSYPSKTLELDDGTVLKGVVRLENIEGAEFGEKVYLSGDSCAWVKDIEPIPITPEILEKNGWMLFRMYHWFIEKECLKLRLLELDNHSWYVYIGDNLIRRNMHSVSDLQHILFGLGINHEMEV